LNRGTIEGLEPDAIVGTSIAISGAGTFGGTLGVTGAITATGGVAGAVTGNVTGNVTGVQFGTVDTRANAGAVSVTTTTTQVTTTGAAAITLANGTAGQIKVIVMTVDGGDATLTPATKTGFATITFGDVGDAVILQYFTTLGWMIIANYGASVA
jgi:hypothetical protein